MYRPEGWRGINQPFFVLRPLCTVVGNALGYWLDQENASGLFEAGADAMLEELKKQGVPTKEIGTTITGNRLSVWIPKDKSGTWVFIPDE